MNDVNRFKAEGNAELIVPLAEGFERVLFEFIQLAAAKTGFDTAESGRIATQISAKLSDRLTSIKSHDHPTVAVVFSHRSGQISIRTEIASLGFHDLEQFHL